MQENFLYPTAETFVTLLYQPRKSRNFRGISFFSQSHSELVFARIRYEHGGNYRCVGNNFETISSVSDYADITIIRKSVISVWSTCMSHAQLLRMLIFFCSCSDSDG